MIEIQILEQFFNLRKTSNSLSQTVIDAVKNATVPAEAQKNREKIPDWRRFIIRIYS